MAGNKVRIDKSTAYSGSGESASCFCAGNLGLYITEAKWNTSQSTALGHVGTAANAINTHGILCHPYVTITKHEGHTVVMKLAHKEEPCGKSSTAKAHRHVVLKRTDSKATANQGAIT